MISKEPLETWEIFFPLGYLFLPGGIFECAEQRGGIFLLAVDKARPATDSAGKHDFKTTLVELLLMGTILQHVFWYMS